MKLSSYKLNKFLFVSLVLGANYTFAQVKTETQKTEDEKTKTSVTEEVEVVRSYKPVLADAVKIRRSPDLDAKKTFNPKVKYNLLDKKLDFDSEIKELEAQKILPETPNELENNYAKFGIGNLGTTIGGLHIGTGKDEALQAGFNFNHWAMSNGKLNKQKMSGQDVGIYGRSIGENIVLEGKLNYNRRGSYFYGIDPDNSFTNTDPKKQRFNIFEGSGEIYNRVDAFDANKLAYAAKVNGYIFNNIFEGKESAFILSGGLSKNLSKFQIGANAALDLTTTKDLAYSINNNIFKLNPFIKLDGDKFKLKAGINFVSEFGDEGKSNIYPNVNLDFSLIPNYLSIFGILDGDVYKTRLRDLSDVNPFLNENIAIKNRKEKLNITGGIKGTVAANVGFKAYVSYKSIDNFSYFVNDTTRKETFNVEYDEGTSNVLGVTGEVNIQISSAFRLDGKLELNQFNLKKELNAWHVPSAKLTTSAALKLAKKFNITADLYLQGDTKAKVYNKVFTTDINNNVIETTETIIKTNKAFGDLGLGLEYQHNKKISGFIRANNIFNSDYQRYLYYPSYGVNILAGLTYGF